jgi:hypothetical protein
MPFEWSSFVDIAESLHQQASGAGNSEANLRSAVNRAYFGAFGHANNHAIEFLQYRPKGDFEEHGRLREHLRRKRRVGPAERLNRLRNWRNEVDYLDVLTCPDLSQVAAEAIKDARYIIAALPPPAAKS